MGIAGLIVVLIILLVGGFYIHTVNRVNRLDGSARTLAGDIDTIIWDRNHVWEMIVAFLEKKGITLDEEMTKKLPLSLGMPVSLQMSNHTILQTRSKALEGILEEHPELKEDEELKSLTTRLEQLRVDIISASSKYNASARVFNGYVEGGFASFVAARKNKIARPYFSHELAEVGIK